MPTSVTRRLGPGDVHDDVSLADYAQQRAGIPFPVRREWPVLKRNLREFFAAHPDASWATLAEIVDWCRSRKRRLAHAYALPAMFRYAWADGALHTYEPGRKGEEATERAISAALAVEQDPGWRARLILSRGARTRRGVVDEWARTRSTFVVSP